MIEVQVYNQQGEPTGTLNVDEASLGGCVRRALLKQAIDAYHANQHVGTAATKSRGMIAGSTRKLFRQKGTGNARMGTIRTNLRRGGGVAFAKQARDPGKKLTRKMRTQARNSALLSKLRSQDVLVLETLKYDSPKTKPFAQLLGKLGVDRSCLLALDNYDTNVYLSARNVDRLSVCLGEQLNAYELLRHHKLLITRQAFERLTGGGTED
ncbi:MAG: 50S ribosomal protein L4 [Phycisphaerae bacterium]|nr:50S ribosomal protein L4 [Phycisphaerae bacterium]